MGRQHLAVGVDVDTLALSLLQQQLQIVEIVTGNDDEGTLLYGEAHPGRLRMAKGFGVGLVQHRHAPIIHFTHFQHDGQQFFHTPIVHTDGKQGLVQEVMDCVVLIAQNSSMVSIGSHTTDAEQNQRLEGTNVLVCVPQLIHIVVVVPTAGRSAVVAFGNQLPLLFVHLIHDDQQSIVIEIHRYHSSR